MKNKPFLRLVTYFILSTFVIICLSCSKKSFLKPISNQNRNYEILIESYYRLGQKGRKIGPIRTCNVAGVTLGQHEKIMKRLDEEVNISQLNHKVLGQINIYTLEEKGIIFYIDKNLKKIVGIKIIFKDKSISDTIWELRLVKDRKEKKLQLFNLKNDVNSLTSKLGDGKLLSKNVFYNGEYWFDIFLEFSSNTQNIYSLEVLIPKNSRPKSYSNL